MGPSGGPSRAKVADMKRSSTKLLGDPEHEDLVAADAFFLLEGERFVVARACVTIQHRFMWGFIERDLTSIVA